MKRAFRAFAGAAALVVVVGALSWIGAATAPVSAAQSLQPTTGALSRVVMIDGRRVRIEVTTWLDVIPSFRGGSSVGAFVNISTVHGRPLPTGFRAEKLLLSRTDEVASGERRSWNPTLAPVMRAEFDPSTQWYTASRGPSWEAGTPCDVLVRLNVDGRVMRVRVGRLNVAEVY